MLTWLLAHKGAVLMVFLVILAFFAGRNTAPASDGGTLRILKKEGDSLRNAVKIERRRAIMEATHRATLENLYRGKLRQADSLRDIDKQVIKKYSGIIGIKHTPHELEVEMADIYARRNQQPQR